MAATSATLRTPTLQRPKEMAATSATLQTSTLQRPKGMAATTTFKAVFINPSGTKRFIRRSFESAKLSFEDVMRWCSAVTSDSACQQITWHDEENDVIAIANQDDLQECIRSHTERGSSPIRLTVTPADAGSKPSKSTSVKTTWVIPSVSNNSASAL